MRYTLLIYFLVCAIATAQGQELLDNILATGSPRFQQLVDSAKLFEIQIIYSQIDRDINGLPRLRTQQFEVDDARYFYPASTVKMPVACFALEKLNEMNIPGVTMDTPIAFGSVRSPQYSFNKDTTATNSQLTLRHLIKKVFLTSDNEAYNMLYAFCGQGVINDRMHKIGFENNKITHRVGAGQFTIDDNRLSNPFLFYVEDDIRYLGAALYNPSRYDDVKARECIKGEAYFAAGELVKAPFNFCDKNFVSLSALHDILVGIVLPGASAFDYNFTDDQRTMLMTYMSQRPRESQFPNYGELPDNYVKFLLVGDEDDPMPDALRIFNKVGYAYGYLTDVAYIVDLDRGIEFILAATIHVNANKTYNDDTYEYDTVGIPFLAELGRLIYAHESQRKHNFDASKLKALPYD